MMPPRPRYAPAAQQIAGMPVPAPYGQPPQGYSAVPTNYPPRGAPQPRPPNVPSNTRGAGTSPTSTAPRGVPTGPPPPNGAAPRPSGQTVPPGGIPSTRAPPPVRRLLAVPRHSSVRAPLRLPYPPVHCPLTSPPLPRQ